LSDFRGTYSTNTAATDTNSFAGGNESFAFAKNSFAFGNGSQVVGLNGIALGNFAQVFQADGIAIGSFVKSNAANSLVFGTGSSNSFLTNSKSNSLMFGVSSLPSLTIVKPTGGADIGYLGIGTEEPEEMAHIVGKVLIESTEQTTSGLQFKPYVNNNSPGTFLPHYWDIYSDASGLNFNTIEDKGNKRHVVINRDGFVGIGGKITTPKAKLHVDENILAEGKITTLNKFVLSPAHNSSSGYWEISRSNTGLNYAYKDNVLQNVLFIGNNGFIGVGKTNPSAALDVNGALNATSAKIDGLICAKAVRVQNGSPCWPDFVFSKDYKLLSLDKVEQFITENHHLPNVPSAAEVAANGIELGEMNAILLQKVEELTLYIIQMEKRLVELEKNND